MRLKRLALQHCGKLTVLIILLWAVIMPLGTLVGWWHARPAWVA
jgi:hypothetical protein